MAPKPLCSICSQRHWTYEAHVFPKAEKAPSPPLVRGVVHVVEPVPDAAVAVRTASGKSGRDEYAEAGKFDRKAYQREYMREYMRRYKKQKPREMVPGDLGLDALP